MPKESEKRVPRLLQQQPRRESDPQQQRSGATDFQSHRQAQDAPDADADKPRNEEEAP